VGGESGGVRKSSGVGTGGDLFMEAVGTTAIQPIKNQRYSSSINFYINSPSARTNTLPDAPVVCEGVSAW